MLASSRSLVFTPVGRCVVTVDVPWVEPHAFDSSPASFREHALAISRMLHGKERLWLGSFARPSGIRMRAPAAKADGCGAPTACAGCLCGRKPRASASLLLPDPEQIALVVPTSGSTGAPKSVAHSVASLKASIHASAHFLGGHGAWLPLLPPTHIAGIQVVARATVTSYLRDVPDRDGLPGALGPVPDARESFSAATVRTQWQRWQDRPGGIPDLPVFTSLVPTQLERLVRTAEGSGSRARTAVEDLRRFEAILVGGAAISQGLLARARALGARIVTTYGSSETAGGCVYNGEPLRGTELKVTDADRLMISTPSLALGYVSASGEFTALEGDDEETRRKFFRMPELATTRVFLTSDIARLDSDPATGSPRLTILGRGDDVIISGGRKIVPQLVESVLMDSGHFKDVLVVKSPSLEWGEEAVGLVVPHPRGESSTYVRTADPGVSSTVATAVTEAGLPRYMIPRRILIVESIPRLASGKVDRVVGARIANSAGESSMVTEGDSR